MAPDPQSMLAALCGLAFVAVWGGLAAQIVKIARRGTQPPRFHPLLQSLHVGRFAGWALVGAAVLAPDPITAWLLLTTRIPAVALVALTFVQRRTPRPRPAVVLGTTAASMGLVAGLAWLIAASVARVPDSAAPIERTLSALVLACFAVQLSWALPRQIASARRQPLGNLRWFQSALALSYGTTFLYAFTVRAAWIQWIMLGVYGLAFVEQTWLVVLIERGVRAKRIRDARAPGSPS